MSDQHTGGQPNERLKRERLLRGWSQQDVAGHVGTDSYTISRWERGRATPSPYFRQRLCELFGKNTEALGLLEEGRETEQRDDEKHQAPAIPTLPAYWSVPRPRNPFFTGRERLFALLHQQTTSPSSAFSGLGGIGKTAAALEYAYRFSQDYSAVFWIDAETASSIMANYQALAQLLHLPERQERDQSKVVAAVLQWLNTHQQWLLIIDNVDDIDLISRFLPTARQGFLLFTTRLQTLGTLAQMIEVEPLSQQESQQFLLRRASALGSPTPQTLSSEEEACVLTLIQVMGGLPLALDQAGSYLKKTQCGWLDFLHLLQTSPVTLLSQRESHSEHPASVVKTFLLAFTRLEQANPLAAEILTMCSFLASEAIPERLLTTFLLPRLQLTPQSPQTDVLWWNTLCEEMLAYGLLSRFPHTKTVAIHRLIQTVLKERLPEQSQQQWETQALHLLAFAFPEEQPIEQWSWCEQLLPHALFVLHQQAQHQTSSAERGTLLLATASYLTQRARYSEAEPLYQQARAIQEQMLGPEHPAMATMLNHLAEVQRKQGLFSEAEQGYRQVLSLQEADQIEKARSLYGLASILDRRGQFAEARSLFQQALTIQEHALGPMHAEVANTLTNLAVTCFNQGDHREAEQLFQRTFQIREHVFGPLHPELATSLNNLAIVARSQGKVGEVEALYHRALHIREQALGPNHPQLAGTLTNLADLYLEQHRFKEAETLLQRSLHIRQNTLGQNHPDLACTLTNLAEALIQQERETEAEPLLQQALQILEGLSEPLHPEMIYPCYLFAVLYRKQGKRQEAEPYAQRALLIYQHYPAYPDASMKARLDQEIFSLPQPISESEHHQMS